MQQRTVLEKAMAKLDQKTQRSNNGVGEQPASSVGNQPTVDDFWLQDDLFTAVEGDEEGECSDVEEAANGDSGNVDLPPEVQVLVYQKNELKRAFETVKKMKNVSSSGLATMQHIDQWQYRRIVNSAKK